MSSASRGCENGICSQSRAPSSLLGARRSFASSPTLASAAAGRLCRSGPYDSIACGPTVPRQRQNMATTDRHPSISVTPTAPQHPVPPPLRPGNVTAVGPRIAIRGRLTATEHVIIEGVFEGEIVIPDHDVAIGGAAHLCGDVCARAITVLGRVDGNLTAFALIELRSTAVVTGRLASPHLSIEEGARFHGMVDPTKTAAAVAVARHRLPQPGIGTRVTVSDAADT